MISNCKKIFVITTVASIDNIIVAIAVILYCISLLYTHGIISRVIESDTDLSMISFSSVQCEEKCLTAYEAVLYAEFFAYGPIGYAGIVPDLIHAFGVLLICENAIDHFVKLEHEATLEGKLYALCGLYYLDYDNYYEHISKYLNDSRNVMEMSGCVMMEIPISWLIKLDGAIRLRSIDDTTGQWVNRNFGARNGWMVDFYGGGIPDSVLYYTGLGRYRTIRTYLVIFDFYIPLSRAERVDLGELI